MENKQKSTHCPGSIQRDAGDQIRLQNARDRHRGFELGQYLQPAPMIFTRDGHNVFLGDMYRGCSAFLACSGPSLKDHDLARLRDRGVITMAVNNAATVVQPQLWVGVDDPGNFSDVIWRDPGIMKFTPLSHMEKRFTVRNADGDLIESAQVVGDMPNVFGFRRNENFVAEQWINEDTFNWGNHSNIEDIYGQKGSRSVMYVALRLLYFLGIRRVFLIGCDFRMELGKDNYAFEQARSPSSVRGNNSSYRIMNVRMRALQEIFLAKSFLVYNCTPRSGLEAFPSIPFNEAVCRVKSQIPKTIRTAGMYDRNISAAARGERRDSPVPESREKSDLRPRRSRTQSANNNVPSFTLITSVSANNIDRLLMAWNSWMTFHPDLRYQEIIVTYHEGSGINLVALKKNLGAFPRLRLLPWLAEVSGQLQLDCENSLLKAVIEKVNTPWFLRLEPDVLALSSRRWLSPAWFLTDDQGRLPAVITSCLNKMPDNTLVQSLNKWADNIPSLGNCPQLGELSGSPKEHNGYPCVGRGYFWGHTDWTKVAASHLTNGLPVPSFNDYLFYIAFRKREKFHCIDLADYSWKRYNRIASQQAKFDAILPEFSKSERTR